MYHSMSTVAMATETEVDFGNFIQHEGALAAITSAKENYVWVSAEDFERIVEWTKTATPTLALTRTDGRIQRFYSFLIDMDIWCVFRDEQCTQISVLENDNFSVVVNRTPENFETKYLVNIFFKFI